MGDRPILFSAPMVRALLAGTKTQTRRVIKPQPFIDDNGNFCVPDRKSGHWNYGQHIGGRPCVRNYAKKLRIKVGDRLWVKETSRITSWGDDGEVWITYLADEARSGVLYPDDEEFLERLCNRVEKAGAKLDGDGRYIESPASALSRPSIVMPRWASRITLTVTDVRVERLHDISISDAEAEGALVPPYSPEFAAVHAVPMYQAIWSGINGPGSWDANPWVAAYTFTVALGNIDQVPA